MYFTMGLPDADIWGFTHVDTPSMLHLSDVEQKLLKLGANLKEVVYSMYDSKEDRCVWVVAANRELSEDEVKDTILFLIENDIIDEFLLGGNDY